jgi:hypothetical protein
MKKNRVIEIRANNSRQAELRRVRNSIRENAPDMKNRIHITQRPSPNHYITKTVQNIAHGLPSNKPRLYTWRPIGCTKKMRYAGEWCGSTDMFDPVNIDEKGTIKPYILMPESTYKNPKTRDLVYAHELVEIIRHEKGDTATKAHQIATKVEKPIAKKYGMTVREHTYLEKKQFNEAYACEDAGYDRPSVYTKPKKKGITHETRYY